MIARGTDIRLDREPSAVRSISLCVVMDTYILNHLMRLVCDC